MNMNSDSGRAFIRIMTQMWSMGTDHSTERKAVVRKILDELGEGAIFLDGH